MSAADPASGHIFITFSLQHRPQTADFHQTTETGSLIPVEQKSFLSDGRAIFQRVAANVEQCHSNSSRFLNHLFSDKTEKIKKNIEK